MDYQNIRAYQIDQVYIGGLQTLTSAQLDGSKIIHHTSCVNNVFYIDVDVV